MSMLGGYGGRLYIYIYIYIYISPMENTHEYTHLIDTQEQNIEDDDIEQEIFKRDKLKYTHQIGTIKHPSKP